MPPYIEDAVLTQRHSRKLSGLSAREWRDVLTSCADTIENERKARLPRPIKPGELVGITARSNQGSGALPSRGEEFSEVGFYRGNIQTPPGELPLHEVQLWPTGERHLSRYDRIVPFGSLKFFACRGQVWEVTEDDFRRVDLARSSGEIAGALDAIWHARNKVVPDEMKEDVAA